MFIDTFYLLSDYDDFTRKREDQRRSRTKLSARQFWTSTFYQFRKLVKATKLILESISIDLERVLHVITWRNTLNGKKRACKHLFFDEIFQLIDNIPFYSIKRVNFRETFS